MATTLTPVVNLNRYTPVLTSDAQLEATIARRNIAWARMQDAAGWLDATPEDAVDIRARRREFNEAQQDYEHASRDLERARVLNRTDR